MLSLVVAVISLGRFLEAVKVLSFSGTTGSDEIIILI